jgi:WD40 repeat protein/tRNA A-37 threonylcarbamoyl transferase component Bud32
MSYCLNPICQQPKNPADAKFCQNCGLSLLLNDRYRVLKLIGQGGFGRTYLAIDQENPEQPACVIKQFLPKLLGDRHFPKAINLFEQEAARLAQLGDHPQIPHLLDYFERSGGQYLIQEFIDGRNLAEVLAAEGSFSETWIRRLLKDLLPVLQFVHDHQIIHRDIKPENILCSNSRNSLALVDFGASKLATSSALAQTGTIIGSAGYVAPEQAIGRAEYASDLYSLGITCAHLLTDIHPFDLYSVSEDAWVWRQYLSKPLSDQLTRVLDKMLQRATGQRYRTADAILRDLNASPIVLLSSTRQVTAAIEPVTLVGEPAQLRPSVSVAEGSIGRATESWHCRHVLTGHAGAVTSIAMSPDGLLLASASSDRTLRLWDLATGNLLHSFAGRSLWFSAGHSDRVSTVTFSPDGQTLISGSDDGTIKLWDLTTKKLVITLTGHEWVISAIAVSLNGQILVSGSGDGVINRWDLNRRKLTSSITKHRDRISGLVISSDGQTLISSGYDRAIRLWDLSNERLMNTFRGHNGRVSAIAVTPDWRILISSSWDKTLKIWDLSDGKLLKTLTGHSDRISCVAVSPDCQMLASGGEDSTIKLWNLHDRSAITQKYRTRVVRHSWGINTLCFSADGQTLVSGSTDETIKIWQRNDEA